MSQLAGEFIMRLFHSRTVAHVLHLKTRSYAAHKALQKFYEHTSTSRTSLPRHTSAAAA